MKHHLTTCGVDFIGVNIMDDSDGLDEVTSHGFMTLPVVARGDEFASGHDMPRVLELVGLAEEPRDPPSADHLVERVEQIVTAAVRYGRQLPATHHNQTIPGRDRTYLGLVNHIVRHVEKFLGLARGVSSRPERADHDVLRGLERRIDQPSELTARAELVISDLHTWITELPTDDLDCMVETAHGHQSIHDLLANCAYSVAQHSRQLLAVLESLEIPADGPLTNDHYEGLPMPAGIWE